MQPLIIDTIAVYIHYVQGIWLNKMLNPAVSATPAPLKCPMLKERPEKN